MSIEDILARRREIERSIQIRGGQEQIITIKLSELERFLEERHIEMARPLKPGMEPPAVDVEIKVTRLLDGYHRAEGMVKWARDHCLNTRDVLVNVIWRP